MSDRPNPLSIALGGLLLLAMALAYGPLLVEFGYTIWKHKPHYHHVPFIVLAAGLLFARGMAVPGSQGVPGRWWAPVGAVLAWLLLVPAHLVPSPLIGMISFVLLLGAAGWIVCRSAGRPFPIGSWGLLWLVLPPPVGLDGRLIQMLQRQSSTLASQALDVLGINHLMDGNALVLPEKTLFVDEACSGVVSAVSIVSCAAMYGVWRRRAFAHTLLLMALAAGWAMLLNVVRIVAIALAEVLAGWDWAEGLAHTGVGLTTFGLSLITLVATDWLLVALLASIGPRWRELTGEPLHFGQWLVDLWDHAIGDADHDADDLPPARRLQWGRTLSGSLGLATVLTVSVAFAAVGGLNLTRLEELKPSVDFPEAGLMAATLQEEGVMPQQFEGLSLVSVEHQQRDDESLFAQHSVIYHYEEASGQQYLISCDFPYVGGWHELSACYRGIGWRLDGRVVEEFVSEESGEGQGGGTDYAVLDLTKPDGRSALVAFCGWFADGGSVEAPAMTLQESFLRAFRRGQVESRHSFQAQVLVERREGMSATDRHTARRLLELAQSRFATKVAEAL